MLVNLESFGRLGNRLFLGAHLIAFSLKHDLPLLNLGFGDYVESFPWFEGNQSFAYPWRETGSLADARRRLRRYRCQERLPWARRFRYWGDEDWDYDHRDTSVLTLPLTRNKTVLFRSWLFRGTESVVRFKREILDVFRPPEALVQAVDRQVEEWRQGQPVLIGVHVRWEDYRGTEHFIDQAGFASRMARVADLWPGKTVRFILFSNETLPSEGWLGLDCHRSPAPSALFDLTAMARCDYLMGPPSTFSGWASFAGDVPLLTLGVDSPLLRESLFRVVRG